MWVTPSELYPPPTEQAAAKMLGVDGVSIWSVAAAREALDGWNVTPRDDALPRMFYGIAYGEDPRAFLRSSSARAREAGYPETSPVRMDTLMRHRPTDLVQLWSSRPHLPPPFVRVPGSVHLYEAPAYCWLLRSVGPRPIWIMLLGPGYLGGKETE